MNVIDRFDGENEFLSNFFTSPFEFEGIIYATSEHAFQAAKTEDKEERKAIAALRTPGQAKRAGRKVKLREAWNVIRVSVMRQVVRVKFTQHPDLAKKLLATGDAELIEGNNWNDTFWGRCRGRGENWLGKVLMELRAELATAEKAM